MIERLKVGLIVKPQGVRGEVKVQPLTDDILRFKKIKKIFIDDAEYKVINVKIADTFVIVSISGICSRDSAEFLRGKFIQVNREDALELQEGRYFIADIVGSKMIFEDEAILGEVVEITSARTDIFTVKTISNKIVRFPFLKEVVLSVDIEKKLIVLNRKRYLEVCCYED